MIQKWILKRRNRFKQAMAWKYFAHIFIKVNFVHFLTLHKIKAFRHRVAWSPKRNFLATQTAVFGSDIPSILEMRYPISCQILIF